MTDITLHLGDCRDLLPSLPDGSIQAIITDPPYGTELCVSNTGKGGYGRRNLWDTGDGKGRTILNDTNLDVVRDTFPEMPRLVGTGWLFMFYSSRLTPAFIGATSAPLWFGEIIWDKRAPGLGYHIRYQHESIAVFRIGEPRRPTDALLSVIPCPSMRGEEHPHEKPVHVLKKLIKWATSPGDTVLDPFCGSGSTMVACVELDRRGIGIELDPVHFATAQRRIAEAQRRKYDQPVLLEVE